MTTTTPGARRTVLVLNHFAQPLTSPGGTRHVELFTRLEGWDARVVAADRNLLDGSRVDSGSVLETVRVTPYAGNGVARIANWVSYAVTSFGRAVRARPLDAVYGSSPHLLAALSGWTVARLRRVPFVLEIRDVWPKVLGDMGALAETSLVYRVLERLERFLYRRADAVVILADGVRAHLVERGVAPERIHFVPNGADVAAFDQHGARAERREHYGFHGVVAVYAGAHGPANGLDLLLDAAHEPALNGESLQVVLVGDGAEKRRLMERARAERIANVTFLAAIPKSEIPALFAAADIGVHCLADVELFRTGVSPNKLFDYMAAGLPVVTNTPGEVTAFVEASGGGVAVAPNRIADGLRQLMALDDGERRQLGARGRTHLAATRSRSAMAARVESVLDEVAGRVRRGR